jgi:hypothetical protein
VEDELKKNIALNGDGTASWNLEHVGRDGTLYSGPVRFRCSMDPLQLIAADRDYRRLLGDNAAFADDSVANMAFALSQLRQRVVESPPFWQTGDTEFGGGRVKDYSVLQTVLSASIAAQEKYEDAIRAEAGRKAERIREMLGEYSKAQRKAEKEADEGGGETEAE